MPVEHLTGEGEAKASGTGALAGPAHLTGTGDAKASGAGTLHRRRTMPAGAGEAQAGGTGTLHYDLHLTGAGGAQGYGYGWLTWPGKDGVDDAIQDAWYYGQTTRKSMLGSGEARAGGSGEL